jgi:predicted transcriptional regulator
MKPGRSTKDIPVTVNLPPEQVERMRKLATERQVMQKVIIKEALARFLDDVEAGTIGTRLGLPELATRR